jgi:hypothetical protein
MPRSAAQRRVALLRIFEALRHHLASSKGELPQSLDQIKGLGIPTDPLTDAPFRWKVSDGVGLLATPALPESIKSDVAKVYHLEFRIRVK